MALTTDQETAVVLLQHAMEKTVRGAGDAVHPPGSAQLSDTGVVPPAVFTGLRDYANRLGYSVDVRDVTREEVNSARMRGTEHTPGSLMGFTSGWAVDEATAFTITIREDMSAASAARVLAHEIGHVVLGHPVKDAQEWLQRTTAKLREIRENGGVVDSDDDEATVELGAATFCDAAGIGTGRFSRAYLHTKLPGVRDLEAVKWGGLLVARSIWEAVLA